jgi:carbon-monoxide dehydrogenase large subunit
METRGLIAEWDAERGRMTVWGAAKVPFFNRRILSGLIDLPEGSIDMVENDVGGGFGARGEFYPEDFLVPFAARAVGQPVKWIEDRRENLLSMNHARDMDAELEVAFRDDGIITGLRGQVHVDVGAYLRTNGLTAVNNVVQAMSGAYRIENIDLRSFAQMTNKTPCGTYRGPGRFEATFFFERLLDLVAGKLGMDRVEIRRRNLITAADMPYQLAAIKPEHPYAITSCDSGDYRVTLERCLEEFDWEEKKQRFDGKLIDGRYHGLSVGCFIEGGAAGPKENARLTMDADGAVSVFVGSSALGQGLETVFAQIAADTLDLPFGAIKGVFHGSTDHVSEGFGSFHSRASVMGGSAIINAAENLKEEICTMAARALQTTRDAVRFVDGRIIGPGGKAHTLRELGITDCAADGTFASSKNTYAYGAHAAHVAVDPGTGYVEVLDYFAIEDVGRIINPETLHGQLLGAIVQGLGSTFLEHLVYDDNGQLLTGSLADYLMPTATDFPRIRGLALEQCRSPNNPLGTKGAGEGGIIPVGGVIANAIASALSVFGVCPNVLPLSPQNIWKMIEDARSAQQGPG